MAHYEVPGGPRLPADIWHPGGNIDVKVGVGVEHPSHPGKVLSVTAHVGANESNVGVYGYKVFQCVDEDLETGVLPIGKVPVRVHQEFLYPFVPFAERLEESGRVSNMDQHGQVRLCCQSPHRPQSVVITQHEGSGLVPDVEADVLPDLEPGRATLDRVVQALHQAVRPPRLLALVPVKPTKRGKPPRVSPVIAFEVGIQGACPLAIKVYDGLHVAVAHLRHESGDVLNDPCGPFSLPTGSFLVMAQTEVAVHIYNRAEARTTLCRGNRKASGDGNPSATSRSSSFPPASPSR